ncbi:MAG TPA: hypothetical protein VFO77_10790 [Actinoplanes sp.]|nr:hypothetical protein [Actinoplanes sp.]
MSSPAKWWSRVTAAVTGVVLMLTIPAYAWAASNGVSDVAEEFARKKGGGILKVGGVLTLLCCLVVVGGIVLAVVLIMKKRGKR